MVTFTRQILVKSHSLKMALLRHKMYAKRDTFIIITPVNNNTLILTV